MPAMKVRTIHWGQILTILSVLVITVAGGMWLARAESGIVTNTKSIVTIVKRLDIHEQILALLKGTHAERENLMATYVAWCATERFGANSSECIQAGIWEARKHGRQ